MFAAVTSLVLGLVLGADDLAPAWPSAGWLFALALTSQVVGWMLITVSLPRLPAAMTSLILTIQPIGSVLLGALLLAQEPTRLQLVGVRSSWRRWCRSPCGASRNRWREGRHPVPRLV